MDISLRPVMSSREAGTYSVAKELARMLRPLVGHSLFHIRNTKDFVEHSENSTLEEREYISACDIKAFLKYVPVDPTTAINKSKMEQDTELLNRTSVSIPIFIALLGFCNKNTYFLYQGNYYEHVQGAAMGSPMNPIAAIQFVDDYEARVINTFPSLHPRFWRRYVDDTFVIQNIEHKNQFLEHICSIDPHVQYTAENTRPNVPMPLLDTLDTPEQDRSLSSVQGINPYGSIFTLSQRTQPFC